MPRPLARAGAAALALAAALPGCTSLDAIPAGTVVTCNGPSDCPSGRVCSRGRCVDPGVVDTIPPALAGGTGVEVRPERVRAGQPLTVTFTATEALEGAPAVTLAASPDVAIPCHAGAANAWSCTYTPTGGENGGTDGRIPVSVVLRDLSGNEANLPSIARVTLDFAPPAPKIASVAYAPGAANPLPAVARATAGTRIQVVVSADELLATAPPPSLVGRCGAATLAFAPTTLPGLAANDAAFEATVGLEPDGVYTLAVTWTDDLGNEGTALVADTAEIRKTPPVLTVDHDALVFVRSPLGNAEDEVLGAYTIPRGPYFAVEPSDVFTTSATLPAGALLLGGGILPSRVIVQSTSSPDTALVLGVLAPAGGRFPRQKLVSPDLAGVWLVGVDDAGNRSAAVRLRESEWVATPNPPAFGASPHGLVSLTRTGPTRDADGAQPVAPPEVSAPDGASSIAVATPSWEPVSGSTAGPGRRSGHAMAYDAARGRVVLFGGTVLLVPSLVVLALGDTWEWDGNRWTQVADGGPGATSAPVMAYDGARGRVVLHRGGSTRETWEWDGATWLRRGIAGPAGVTAMTYDPIGARILALAGGTLWEWDGATWTSRAGSGPSVASAMAYDAARSRLVASGTRGTGGTWEWDGSTWTSLAVGNGEAMAYDTGRRRVVAFDGTTAATWNGAAWTPIAAGKAVLSERDRGYRIAYDTARQMLVLFGGETPSQQRFFADTWQLGASGGWYQVASAWPGASWPLMAYDSDRARVVMYTGQTWEWDGATWTYAAVTGPPTGSAMAYDSARHRTVLVGTADSVTWLWDGASWTSRTVPGPPGATGRAMAFDRDHAGGQIVLSGGGDASTWLWNGTSWTERMAALPGALTDPAMAYDGERRRIVLHGGVNPTSGPTASTWEWDGTAWSSIATGTAQGEFSRHALAFDASRRRVVRYGGRDPVGDSSATVWEWDGVSWSPLPLATAGRREFHAMAYDAARGTLVVFGGRMRYLGTTQPLLGDTWLWHAGGERTPAFQFQASAAALGIDPALVTTVHVRAHAGGTFTGGTGATLEGWARRGDLDEPGAWLPLAHVAAAAGAPPSQSLFERRLPGDVARRHLAARDGFAFRVRADGGTGTTLTGSSVTLDFIEVRVRYLAP